MVFSPQFLPSLRGAAEQMSLIMFVYHIASISRYSPSDLDRIHRKR